MDPPRAGLHKAVLKALRENNVIDRIVYISCNAESMADDIVKLCHPEGERRDQFVPRTIR